MPLKKSTGNMYPWVTHMHTHLGGECLHRCGYCYVQTNPHGVHPRYKGEIRLIESELKVNYGARKTIFIEHMNDLFAEGIPSEIIEPILHHTRIFPRNRYVFQTKNPKRGATFLKQFPADFMMGTTIESNRLYKDTKAPKPEERYAGLKLFEGHETFLTIEPIMDFDLEVLLAWLKDLWPSFINIGADSKRCNLPEPPKYKIDALLRDIKQTTTIPVKNKSNLSRLIQEYPREGERSKP